MRADHGGQLGLGTGRFGDRGARTDRQRKAMELILYAQIASFEALQPFVKGYVPLGKTFGRGPQLRGVWIDK